MKIIDIIITACILLFILGLPYMSDLFVTTTSGIQFANHSQKVDFCNSNNMTYEYNIEGDFCYRIIEREWGVDIKEHHQIRDNIDGLYFTGVKLRW